MKCSEWCSSCKWCCSPSFMPRAVKRDSHFSGFAPRANLSHVNFLSDGTLEVVMVKKK